MSTNNTQAPQGVTGNTHTALNGALGTTTTSFRGIFRKDNAKWWGYALITSFLVVMVIGYTASGVQFAGLILTGLIALYIGNKLRQKPDKGIGALVSYAAIALIAGTIIASDLGQASLGQVNKAEQKLSVSIASGGCPNKTEPAKVDGVYEVVHVCGTLQLTGNLPKGVTYQVLEGHGDLDFEDNLKDVDRPAPNVRLFTVLDTVPKDTVVKFRIVSAEESAELDAAAEKKPDLNPLFRT